MIAQMKHSSSKAQKVQQVFFLTLPIQIKLCVSTPKYGIFTAKMKSGLVYNLY